MTWISTYTGKAIDLLDPDWGSIDILDIAHALAHQCRFTGHTREFYSVAQHSVLVSQQVPPEHALEGLLHDAAEAYCADLAKPIKHLPGFEAYNELEARLQRAVTMAFGVPTEMSKPVKEADRRILTTEAKCLLTKPPRPWTLPAEPYPDLEIKPLPPDVAKAMFLASFQELTA